MPRVVTGHFNSRKAITLHFFHLYSFDDVTEIKQTFSQDQYNLYDAHYCFQLGSPENTNIIAVIEWNIKTEWD